jgi:hypothetical protein
LSLKINNIKVQDIVPVSILKHYREKDLDYLAAVFKKFNGYPNLEQMWRLMNEQWVNLGCDPFHFDERVSDFYQHPVWVLNGLFSETDKQSLKNRILFTNWVVEQQPARVADFGGGFGGLARMIGKALPNTKIEVVDPHPHPAAIALAAETLNVRFVSELTGTYDVLIATDVFEHVPDPIGLVADTAKHLHIGGHYLIANCFLPVILCHLPQNFHFNSSWDLVMKELGLVPEVKVGYGRSFMRQQKINVINARQAAKCGQKFYLLISWLPRGRARVGAFLIKLFYKSF